MVATVWLFRSTDDSRENEDFCILRCAVEFMTILLVQTGLAGNDLSGLNNEVSLIVLSSLRSLGARSLVRATFCLPVDFVLFYTWKKAGN